MHGRDARGVARASIRATEAAEHNLIPRLRDSPEFSQFLFILAIHRHARARTSVYDRFFGRGLSAGNMTAPQPGRIALRIRPNRGRVRSGRRVAFRGAAA